MTFSLDGVSWLLSKSHHGNSFKICIWKERHKEPISSFRKKNFFRGFIEIHTNAIYLICNLKYIIYYLICGNSKIMITCCNFLLTQFFLSPVMCVWQGPPCKHMIPILNDIQNWSSSNIIQMHYNLCIKSNLEQSKTILRIFRSLGML